MPQEKNLFSSIESMLFRDNLIASYEELFMPNDGEKHYMRWFGDMALHVPKDGITDAQLYDRYSTALQALGKSHEEFLSNDKYYQRGHMVIDMCKHSNIPIPEHYAQQAAAEGLDLTVPDGQKTPMCDKLKAASEKSVAKDAERTSGSAEPKPEKGEKR